MMSNEIANALKSLGLEPIRVVDVGASDLGPTGDRPPYQPLDALGLIRLTGFEPNEAEFKKLEQTEAKTYLPYAVGDGAEATLYITRSHGFTSTLRPNQRVLGQLHNFGRAASVAREVRMSTRALDDIEEIPAIDFFKIDIQGGELNAMRGGRAKLAETLCIHTEVAFVKLYEDQPLFPDQDRYLKERGFELFAFQSMNSAGHAAGLRQMTRPQKRRELKQIVDGDAIYFPARDRIEELGDQEVLKLLAIALLSYNAISFGLHLMNILTSRGIDCAGIRELALGGGA